MSRKVDVNKSELKQQVELLESSRVFNGQTEMWQALGETEWAKSNGYNWGTLYNKAKKYGIKPTTKSSRGNHLLGTDNLKKYREENAALGASRETRADKIQGSADGRRWILAMKRDVNTNTNPVLLDKVANGNLSATIDLMCISCCAGDKQSVKECGCESCPLWYHRPYQGTQEGANA